MPSGSRYPALDLAGIKRRSIVEASRKVSSEDLAIVNEPTPQLQAFLLGLPGILAGREFKEFLDELARRRRSGQPLVLMFGGHVVKCGLAPLLIDLMQRGYVQALATNGSGAIHDVEMALYGRTSEDVAEGLADGSFGMVRETGDFFHDTLRASPSEGFGEALGRRLLEEDNGNDAKSIVASGYRLGIPVSVHVAIGTDIVHQHPSLPAAALGEATYRDFRILCAALSRMETGGVVLNIGSAVVLPEVFLKALTVVRNLGFKAHDIVTANFDMLQHYRPRVNVVDRPTRSGGRGFNFTGHHEIMVPLLHAGMRCAIELAGQGS
jgi:hypothetical protein